MRKDILSVISGEKDITNVIVLTHNIDFVFIQNMVVPALRKCGHPSLTIFADADCAAETYEAQHMVLDLLGKRYRVVPISMQPGFRFHPKAVFLSGQEKGVLLIGSGNLTFGGWRENAEIWCRYDTDIDGTAAFSAFRDYLLNVSALASLNMNPESEIKEAFDEKTRGWAADMAPPGGLFGKPGSDIKLLSQMQAEIGDQSISEIFVCAPYFDATFPWVWEQDLNEVASALKDILANSRKKLDNAFLKKVESRWARMMREGYALHKFECAIGDKCAGDLKDKIRQKNVNKGEVLWQGGNRGFCIAKHKFVRAVDNAKLKKQYAKIISLVSDDVSEISPSFAIPVRALIKKVFPEGAMERWILEDIFEKIAVSVGKTAEVEKSYNSKLK
jgi:hypothetical protein